MKIRGHAVQYPPGVGGVIGKFYNMLLVDGHVDSKLLGKVLDACPTLYDKVHFLNAVLLQPQTDQQREWIEALGLAWGWTDVLYQSEFKIEVLRSGCEEQATECEERTIN
jgi:prepilin-type processing-associated H-X9-DG protein